MHFCCLFLHHEGVLGIGFPVIYLYRAFCNECKSCLYLQSWITVMPYCGLPAHTIKKLQHVLNAEARLVTFTRRYDHITPVLFNLHWLPVNQHIIFKILCITYKALNNLAPLYICDLLTSYTPSRQLCSSSKTLFYMGATVLKYKLVMNCYDSVL